MLDACHEFGQLHNLRHSKLVVSYGASIQVSNKQKLPLCFACYSVGLALLLGDTTGEPLPTIVRLERV